MPNPPLVRYALDKTGVNPDNLVSGDIKTLSNQQIRAAVPTYGPYFAESMIIYDNISNALLIKNVDYELVDLLQDPTAWYGKEIMQAVLIKNTAVSNQIRMTYQALGGNYQNNVEGLNQMYDAVVHDSRPIAWENLFDKPEQYPPIPHLHLLNEVVGFGPVIVSLERIRDAIVLSNIPAFEQLIEWVKAYAGGAVLFDPMVPSVSSGQTKSINIQTSNQPNGTRIFWKIVHHGTDDTNFASVTGSFTLFQNRGSFAFQTLTAPLLNSKFDVEIRLGAAQGGILTKIEGIVFPGTNPAGAMTMSSLLNACCLNDPGVKTNALSLYMIGEPKYA